MNGEFKVEPRLNQPWMVLNQQREREREGLCELVQEEVSVADEEPLVEASGNGGT